MGTLPLSSKSPVNLSLWNELTIDQLTGFIMSYVQESPKIWDSKKDQMTEVFVPYKEIGAGASRGWWQQAMGGWGEETHCEQRLSYVDKGCRRIEGSLWYKFLRVSGQTLRNFSCELVFPGWCCIPSGGTSLRSGSIRESHSLQLLLPRCSQFEVQSSIF